MTSPQVWLLRAGNGAAFVAACVYGAIALWVVAHLGGGVCTASTQIFEHPLDALTGTPWPESPVASGFDDNPCRRWPSAWVTWLTLWGPVLFVLGTTGALAARLGLTASAISAAFCWALRLSLRRRGLWVE